MTELFRNNSPGALTMAQAIQLEKKRVAERCHQRRQAEELAAQGRGGEGDAWRHARWNQRMANSIGPEAAKRIADWNERKYGNNNSIADRSMDLENNEIGRSLTDNSPLTIDELARLKRLRTKPYPY